jgi:hypothetical protein
MVLSDWLPPIVLSDWLPPIELQSLSFRLERLSFSSLIRPNWPEEFHPPNGFSPFLTAL